MTTRRLIREEGAHCRSTMERKDRDLLHAIWRVEKGKSITSAQLVEIVMAADLGNRQARRVVEQAQGLVEKGRVDHGR